MGGSAPISFGAGLEFRCDLCGHLEILVHLDALLLLHARMNRDRREVALLKQLVELDGALNRLDEDNHLVELERIEQLVELAVLLVLGQLDVVLRPQPRWQSACMCVRLRNDRKGAGAGGQEEGPMLAGERIGGRALPPPYLLEAVQGELSIVHVDLHRVLHELLADDAHLWAKSGREHHHLLLMRGRLEDLLHVLAHVCRDGGDERGMREGSLGGKG